jgi:hypothetical protein
VLSADDRGLANCGQVAAYLAERCRLTAGYLVEDALPSEQPITWKHVSIVLSEVIPLLHHGSVHIRKQASIHRTCPHRRLRSVHLAAEREFGIRS